MKKVLGLLAIALATTSSISYFKYQRQVESANSTGQLYVLVDSPLFQHARPDLSDLRMYAAQNEISYTITVESGGSRVEHKDLRILQPGTIGGKTQFVLDLSGVPEYNRAELKLATTNFVAHARVEGQNDPHGAQWTLLGTTTIYDLSDEKLGRNSTLQIPLSTFKFLRITIDASVKPSDIQSATAGSAVTQEAVLRDLARTASQQPSGKDTVLTFTVPENTPVERISFAFDPAQVNFRRDVEIQDDKGQPFFFGELSRVHLKRNGQSIDSDQTLLDFATTGPRTLKVIIHNGDDVPLQIANASLQQFERRIYFNSVSGLQPTLYYGDDKLDAPVYDYAKLFERDPNATQVQLGAEQWNSTYTGRPDDRPWSERHPAFLWIVIVGVILILAAVALRSMKNAT
jgi:hypothetical protein